jgi:hypothetical protein
MEPLPEITTDHPGIVVDDLNYCVPWLGVFGSPYWEITWRRVEDPERLGVTRLARDDRAGVAELDGQPFSFTVRWRRDLRRRRETAYDDNPVAPPPAALQPAQDSLY